jgi:hypothetical protein
MTRGAEIVYRTFLRGWFLAYQAKIDAYLEQASSFGAGALAGAAAAANGALAAAGAAGAGAGAGAGARGMTDLSRGDDGDEGSAGASSASVRRR